MANTYTWVIDALDCAPSAEGQTNVVNTIHWRVNGTDGTRITLLCTARKALHIPLAHLSRLSIA